ncbi:MAG TPA: molybdopterin-dependent oxidoreductase [Candidatus Acidoferrum sp.]|nr:molybdopterin-dependent oxidoreductase [Candidatus Acidoferrum sp.]
MPSGYKKGLTRRELLSASLLTGGAWFIGAEKLFLRGFALDAPQDPFAGGKLLGTVEFAGESRAPIPMERPLGSELDGRQFTDLAALTLDEHAVPTEKFYIRTLASKLLDLSKPWSIQLPRSGDSPAAALTIPELIRMSEPQGLHLMECAGNTRDGHFGLLSVADWAGVPVAKLAAQIQPKEKGSRILISGFDTYAGRSITSSPGCSWVFTWDELINAGAFFATKMNGEPLTRDHGSPVRLVMPGWYGCTCIKWANEISFVPDDVEATSQMQEFASRTHQAGMPRFAREFEPPRIDPAAMPIRVEKWRVNGGAGENAAGIAYRIIGISWGGPERAKALAIQFNAGGEFVPVDHIAPVKTDSWAFWTLAWRPAQPGTYFMRLKVTDPQVRTRRLDMGFYARAVQIEEV